ncbi:MAG: hypothetical protein FJ405_13565 [Verrucomicrobia bacterium]|nr:hypothetical protein [Verrucomicrobiota bacterium]
MQRWFQAPRSRTLSLLGSGILLLGAGLPGFGEAGATPVLIRSEEPGWAQFRGPYRDGVSREKGLLKSWPSGGPSRLWTTTNLGRGFSSPVISDGRVILTGDKGRHLEIQALDPQGRSLWRTTNGTSYPGRKGWAALHARTGNTLYQLEDVVKGSILSADSRLYAYCEDGWVLLWEAGEGAFIERGRFRFAHVQERDAWAHPVVLDGRLYLRYHDELACFDVRARA